MTHRPHSPLRRIAPCVLATLVVFACCGCHGGGKIELASLHFGSIDPPPPHTIPITMQECYWWQDDDGRVWIAMQRTLTPLFQPKMRFEFQVSLVLDRLPAGKARNYKIGRDTLRGRLRLGPWESRLASQLGILALYREGGDRLRGSLRLQATRSVHGWLGGWEKPKRYLLLGSFNAVPDDTRGRPIADLTQSDGWEHENRPAASAKPSSQPAPTEPATSEQKR